MVTTTTEEYVKLMMDTQSAVLSLLTKKYGHEYRDMYNAMISFNSVFSIEMSTGRAYNRLVDEAIDEVELARLLKLSLYGVVVIQVEDSMNRTKPTAQQAIEGVTV